MSRFPFTLLGRRMHADNGFALLEVVVAMGVILISLTVLASTALVGFSGAQTARQRQTATAMADQLVEQVRGLPFSVITQGIDVGSDTKVVNCSGTYKFRSCTAGASPIGETIVQSSGASTPPLAPHLTTLGAYTRGVYLTYVSGSTSIYRLTVDVSWVSGTRTLQVETATILSNPKGTGSSTQTGSGGSVPATFYGSGNVTPGTVVVTPNGSVYSGIGVTGLTSSIWNTGDSVTQKLASLGAEVSQGQVTKVDGLATLTDAEQSISGTVTQNGGSSTYSSADDDPSTTSVGTSSAPTSITQSDPTVSLSGSGNALTLNQYSQTTTTTTVTGTISKRSSSYATSTSESVTLTAP